MIPSLIADTYQQESNIFDCITMQKEIFVPAKEVPLIYYMATTYPRNEDTNTFQFVYGLFDLNHKVFANNQADILTIANSLFIGSTSLDKFEQGVLNKTFKKSIKISPSLPGRK